MARLALREAAEKLGLYTETLRRRTNNGAVHATLVALVLSLLLLPGVSHALTFKQKALVGLKGVEVLVEGMQPEAERLGLTRAQIQTDVELRLRKAGIRVLTEKERDETPGRPYLYVNVNTIFLQKTPAVVYGILVKLREWVTVDRGLRTLGAIWETAGCIGTVGTQKIIKVIRDDVGDQVDEFINDYLAANPK